MGRLTHSLPVTRVRAHDTEIVTDTRADDLAVEEPLEIHVAGQLYATTMRTPGHDVELAHGLLFSDSIISSREHIAQASFCGGRDQAGHNTYNVLDIELATGYQPPKQLRPKLALTTSACGVCGTSTLEEMISNSLPDAPLPHHDFDYRVLMTLPDTLRRHQKAFRRTGGIHAAGLFTLSGDPIVIREDVGRHNAADKVLGNLIMNNLASEELILVVSSRASFELVHKAVAARCAGLIAVSAATSMAAKLARQSGLFLSGFTRGDRMNIYSAGS